MPKANTQRFESLMMPHLDAVYSFARWIVRDPDAASDMVQETYAKAFAAFDTFSGKSSKGWLFTIGRHTCYAWLRRRGRERETDSFDENVHGTESAAKGSHPFCVSPEAVHEAATDRTRLHGALDELPLDYRETLVLREIEGFSYKEIAQMLKVPIGTVMSRLSRGRARLLQLLTPDSKQ